MALNHTLILFLKHSSKGNRFDQITPYYWIINKMFKFNGF